MAGLIAYVSNRRDRLSNVLHQERRIVSTLAAEPAAAWGIGFYQDGEVLHKKRPMTSDHEIDWDEVASNVRSDCAVIHLRKPTVGDFRAENIHPFRMRRWLFAHDGTIHGFDAIRDRVLHSLPDFLRRNIRGNTDSEAFFHVILSFLHSSGQLDRLDIDEHDLLESLRSSIARIDGLTDEIGAERSALNFALTQGASMVLVRRGPAMAYTTRVGLDETQSQESTPKTSDPQAVRYVLALSLADAPPADFQLIPEDSALLIDRNLQSKVVAL
ncbi:MAG: class II glutamine amidotransferase [Myxococcota bacterium]